ncbi:RHS repeat-associated core domain-containing protein, partial [Burkholderia cenocepacia]|uniref:RHS repeat-associated core domain-containing protein n=1 Tax=Burkholderia cenocepacia TaxID=95486 RepID=UPI0012B3C3E3
QQLIGSLGLYYYKARFYSSGLGRFFQTDPVGYKDDQNLYAYVGNNPVNRTDPDGLTGTALGPGDQYAGLLCQGAACTLGRGPSDKPGFGGTYPNYFYQGQYYCANCLIKELGYDQTITNPSLRIDAISPYLR